MSNILQNQARDEQAPIIYYNGDCPVCRAEITLYQRRAREHGVDLDWVDISTDRSVLETYGIGRDRILRRLHAVEADGHLRAGIEAFVVVWERLPGYRWLARLMEYRLAKTPARLAYEWIAAPLLYRWYKWREARDMTVAG